MSEDAGYGPPPGNPSGPARGGGFPMDRLARQYLAGLEGLDTDDPAFRRPFDATDENTRARARLIYRDIPLVTIQNTWTVEQLRAAVRAHLEGQFYLSGQLCDSILGDDRVTSTLNSRAAALFGREVRFATADESSAARECLDAWMRWWPRLTGDSAIRETQDYGTIMGFAHDQIVWDTHQPGLDYAPSLRPWHPVFEYYSWPDRCFMAIGDTTIPIIPGDGKWLEYAPFGSYRGWIRGALRPVVEPWALRHMGFRDMARFGEVHGSPTRVGHVPILGDPAERAKFEEAITRVGADTAMILPRGIDEKDGSGYDYSLVEATSTAWEVHPAQISQCDAAIVMALLMTALTTEVESGGGGGSYASAKVGMDIRSEGAQLDNQTWRRTYYTQLARPFAYLNFGDANLAPHTWYDVRGREEYASNSKQFREFMTGIEVGRRGGVEFVDEDEVRRYATERFGLDGLPRFRIVPPVSGGMGGGK